MPLQVRVKDITLSEPQKEHLNEVVNHFQKYHLDITKILANIIGEKHAVHVEFEVHVAHQEPIVINEIDEKFDEAVSKAGKRVEKALRRLHDKIKSPKHESIKDLL